MTTEEAYKLQDFHATGHGHKWHCRTFESRRDLWCFRQSRGQDPSRSARDGTRPVMRVCLGGKLAVQYPTLAKLEADWLSGLAVAASTI